ncbi:MAG: hypothetical protein KDA24_10620 [Deltaproteobacteria bacterium]|nr:hypothetical protein [Deltaproteobacteria bacterium]
MHRRASLLIAMLSLLVAGEAAAAACCVLAAPGRTGRLPEAEVFGALAAYSVESRVGNWSNSGDLSFAKQDLQFTHRFVPQLLVRPHRVFQASVAMPILVNGTRFGDDVYTGGGLGDLALITRFEPVAVGSFRAAPPLLGIGWGFSLPTGRATWRVDDGNPAAVTGTGYLSTTPAVTLDKTWQRGAVGWDGSGTFSFPRPGDTTRSVPGIGFSTSVFGAFFASSDVTLSTTLGIRGSTAGWRAGKAVGSPGLEPFGGFGLVLEPRRLHRVTLGMQGSIPIPKLGLSRGVTITASVGYSFSVARGGKARALGGTAHGG